jgi:hypothetical protein
MKQAKHFRINDGKGFAITFANGYTVSVQFGYANYCDNYDFEQGSPNCRGRNVRAGEAGSNTAETALISPSGEFVDYDDGQVQGHRTPEQVLELLNYAQKLEA